MFKSCVIICISLFFNFAEARTIRIGVVDSGMPEFETNLKMCDYGKYDLTHTNIYDKIGHGSNILGIISNGLSDVDYCVVVIKIYDESSSDTEFITHLMAYIYIYYLHIDVVNYSSVGLEESVAETVLIKGLMDHGVTFVAAAGNNNKDLDKNCNAYPACIPGVISVGNLNANGSRHRTSNYGKIVKAWHNGTNICMNKVCMTGSSMSTAFETVEQVKKLANEGKNP